MAMGRFEEAVRVLQNESRVEPDNADACSDLGGCLLFLRRYAEAVTSMEKAVGLKPNSHDCWRNLGDAYRFAPGQAGKADGAYRRALELARRQLAVNPHDWETMASVALYDAHLNKHDEAIRLAERSVKEAPSNNTILFTAALTYEMLGQRSASLQQVRAAYAKGYPLEYIERDPDLGALRKDDRYQAWVRQRKMELRKAAPSGGDAVARSTAQGYERTIK
jgi:serine/threonine-protein kinase